MDGSTAKVVLRIVCRFLGRPLSISKLLSSPTESRFIHTSTSAEVPPAAEEPKHKATGTRLKMSDEERIRLRQRLTIRSHSKTKDANRVVKVALTTNFIDCAIKLSAFTITQSHSMFAEFIHSTLDMVNQICLLVGNHMAMRDPDRLHPYGFGNMRYISSLIAGCAIFGFGCGLSVYSGITGLLNPGELESLPWALGLLSCSACLQLFSLRRAVKEVLVQARLENTTFFPYVRSSKVDPSLKVVLWEDASSIIGVSCAFSMVLLSHLTEMSAFDSVGSILIGLLLGNAALQIIFTSSNHLVGRSLPEQQIRDIVSIIERDPTVRKLHDVKATYVGVTDSMFKAEVDYDGRNLAKAFLQEKCDMKKMIEEVKAIKTEKELEEFLLKYGEQLVDMIGDNVDRLEEKVTEKHPNVRHLDLEPM